MTFSKKEIQNPLRFFLMLMLATSALCDNQNFAEFYNKGSLKIEEVNTFIEGKFPFSSNLKVNELSLVDRSGEVQKDLEANSDNCKSYLNFYICHKENIVYAISSSDA